MCYWLFSFQVCMYALRSGNWISEMKKRAGNFRSKVDERQDHIAEYLFDEATQKLPRTLQIIAAFSSFPIGRESVRKRLSATYFTGYLGKFDNTVWFYSANGQPADSLENPTTLAEFNQQVLNICKSHIGKEIILYAEWIGSSFISGYSSCRVNIRNVLGTMVIQLNAKLFQSEEGFRNCSWVVNTKRIPDWKIIHLPDILKDLSIYEYGSYAYSFFW